MSASDTQSARLALRLLGPFRLSMGEERPDQSFGPKVQVLLAYLATRRGVPQHRDRVATLFWADRGQEQARHSLRQALLTLRRGLAAAGADPVVTDAGFVALDPAAVTTDLESFEALAARDDLDSLRQAEALWAGDFLEGLAVSSELLVEWLERERERLRSLACDLRLRLARALAEAGETGEAIAAARRALAIDPALEEGHQLLMQLLPSAGHRTAALRQYQICAAALVRELGAKPSAETERIAAALRSEHAPAARPVGSPQPGRRAAHSAPRHRRAAWLFAGGVAALLLVLAILLAPTRTAERVPTPPAASGESQR
ncbi:hypothetical protein DFH01_15750 [Falsiroseomonas bella]|uniref:Bacterial transcriptional activator domain-containing protein n=1 Tax=Falsiroseomonas bella TaxID=2184016 RepID=A0A317FGC9_9PROT|nr:BTAD domain-containing putative transcriptional regulator [Falsiroseomonas bella]PWS36596.1 hypothetical protein DFH01_15750 [Falsiroseomonas bella]